MLGWSSNGFHDWLYRLWCELPVLDGLIPLDDAGILCGAGGRGSVIGGAGSSREVGGIWDVKVIPEVKVK